MTKLHQILPLIKTKKNITSSKQTEIYQKIQKEDQFNGLTKVYEPVDEEGEKLPSENKNVQYTVKDAIAEFVECTKDVMNIVATQDEANCRARADIVVDGKIILANVPTTHLLFLEKKLIDIHTFINKLPTLNTAESWKYDSNINLYRSGSNRTNRNKKILKNHIKYEATKEHPAQVDVFSEEIKIGEYVTTKFSGAIPQSEKSQMLNKVQKTIAAIKMAREQANEVEIRDQNDDSILKYIFE